MGKGPTEAFIDAQALLRQKKFDEMIFVLQSAHNIHPDHVGIRIAQAVAGALAGEPKPFDGVQEALTDESISSRDLALAIWILRDAIAAGGEKLNDPRFKQIGARMREMAVLKLRNLKAKVEKDLQKPELTVSEVRGLTQEADELTEAFNDPQVRPGARAAAQAVKQSALNLWRFRQNRRYAQMMIGPLVLITLYLLGLFTLGEPTVFKAIVVTFVLVGEVAFYIFLMSLREAARRFAWRGIGAYEKTTGQAA